MNTGNNGMRELTLSELDVVSGGAEPFSFSIGPAKFTFAPDGRWDFWNGSCKVGDQGGTEDAGCPTPA
jgi:hypothetical protein